MPRLQASECIELIDHERLPQNRGKISPNPPDLDLGADIRQAFLTISFHAKPTRPNKSAEWYDLKWLGSWSSSISLEGGEERTAWWYSNDLGILHILLKPVLQWFKSDCCSLCMFMLLPRLSIEWDRTLKSCSIPSFRSHPCSLYKFTGSNAVKLRKGTTAAAFRRPGKGSWCPWKRNKLQLGNEMSHQIQPH